MPTYLLVDLCPRQPFELQGFSLHNDLGDNTLLKC